MAGVSIETRFMSARSFFDTNVLMHADDKAAPPSNTGPLSWLPSIGVPEPASCRCRYCTSISSR
jgi:hypothetical protein